MPTICEGCLFYYPRNTPWTCELERHPATCGSARILAPEPPTKGKYIMYYIFEVNGSSVVLDSAEVALQVINRNSDRRISIDQTSRWETWAMATLRELGLEDQCTVAGRFDPDAARVVLTRELVSRQPDKGE